MGKRDDQNELRSVTGASLTRPPRCLLVAHTMPPLIGGSCGVYENLAHQAAGAIVVLTSYRDHLTGEQIRGWRDHDRKCGYPIDRIPLVRPRLRRPASRPIRVWRVVNEDVPIYARLAWHALRLVHRMGIGVLCLADMDTNGWLLPHARRVAALKTILYTHGDELAVDAIAPAQTARRRRYLASADAIVAISRYSETILIQRFGVPREKVVLIPNGVDPALFAPAPKPPALLARFGLADKFVLVTVTRLIERKGVDVVLRALPAIRAGVPDVHFLVVGEGPFGDQLRHLAAEQGVADAVTFTGEVPHQATPEYYALGDLFVLPTHEVPHQSEGSPLVLLEASACGLPVIAGRAGGTSQVVTDGVNGLLVEGSDPDELARAILRVASDRDLQRRLRAGGIALARRLDWSSSVQQFLALCDRLTAS